MQCNLSVFIDKSRVVEVAKISKPEKTDCKNIKTGKNRLKSVQNQKLKIELILMIRSLIYYNQTEKFEHN